MDNLIKLLDKNLEYINHEIIEDTLYINVTSNCDQVLCPHCGQPSNKVHSRYKRSFQDMPIQGMKVIIILNNRKMFCNNIECKYKTFAQSFKFLNPKAKKTKRLENQIINISLNVSSITASSILKNSVAKVGKSTICNLLKKSRTNYK